MRYLIVKMITVKLGFGIMQQGNIDTCRYKNGCQIDLYNYWFKDNHISITGMVYV